MPPRTLFDLEDETPAQDGFDIDQALQELRNAIHRIAGNFPGSHHQALHAALVSLAKEYQP